MTTLTGMQKHVMTQVKALPAGAYLHTATRMVSTLRALHRKGFISYHHEGAGSIIVPAGRFSYGRNGNAVVVEYVPAGTITTRNED